MTLQPSPASTSTDPALDEEASQPAKKGFDPKEIIKFRKSDEGKKLAAWATEQFTKCKGLRSTVQAQWYVNLSTVFGRHWMQVASGTAAAGTRLVDS